MGAPLDAASNGTAGTVTSRLALVDVCKRYPGVQANDRVSLEVLPGEIHGVLGENGAGKSTLMKIIYGAVRPDSGRILWEGRPLEAKTPRDARACGISMVFQHFALFESLTVAENVWLGMDRGLSRHQVEDEVQRLGATYGLDLVPGRLVSTLSVGERQRVEILRALVTTPKLLILDEPTSVLTPQAAAQLFVTLRRLADSGCSILYISHKLEEVRALCGRCTVLRAGRVTGAVDPQRESTRSLAELMLGVAPSPASAATSLPGDMALEVRGLSLPPEDELGIPLTEVRLAVRAGEVIGVAGISGNGQAELFAALSGEDRRAPRDAVLLFGRDIGAASPGTRRKLGLRAIPEERIGRGSVPSLSLAANTLLTRREPLSSFGWLRAARARELAAHLIARFGVRAAGPEVPAASLSGGNLQKFLVGRELDARPRVVLVAQPTWGLDVGAAAQIREALVAMSREGAAVIVMSEELEELLEMCTELVVMARGRLSPRLPPRDATPERMSRWMAGQFDPPVRPEGDATSSTATAGDDETASQAPIETQSAQGARVHV